MREQLAVDRIAGRRTPRPGSGHVLGVVAGRGGSGVSLVSALLAFRSALAGHRTLLVDADPWLDVQRIWMRLPKGRSIEALKSGDGGLESLVTPVMENLDLVCLGSGDRADAAYRVWARRLPHLFPERQVVVIDAGSRLEGLDRCVDLRVGSVLVVTDVDAVALGSTHALAKAMRTRLDGAPHVLFNRATVDGARAAGVVLTGGMRRFLGIDPILVGYLPDDVVLRQRLAEEGASPRCLSDSFLAELTPAVMGSLAPWRSA